MESRWLTDVLGLAGDGAGKDVPNVLGWHCLSTYVSLRLLDRDVLVYRRPNRISCHVGSETVTGFDVFSGEHMVSTCDLPRCCQDVDSSQGRGGTCQVSAWDHTYLGLFWMYNCISVVIFH